MDKRINVLSKLFVSRWASLIFSGLLGLVIMAFFSSTSMAGQVITGAGATFPYPIYARWAHDYAQKTGVLINYQSIGSGGGIRQIRASAVSFGASDAPLTAKQLKEWDLVQFPMIMGGIVPVVKLAGIRANQLHLTGPVLADIFLGKITKWNDPRIKAINPGVNLPDRGITVVHRSDGSGTTWIFTHYLCAVSPQWAKQVGAAKAVDWPAGLGGKGNEGVAAYVSRINGAIGYVEYAYALQNHLCSVVLKNKDGKFVKACTSSFQAAAEGADWVHTPAMAVVLVNQPGTGSWPITGASFILVHKNYKSAKTIKSVLKFFAWCYKNGSKSAIELDYVPLPKKVVNLVEKLWSKAIFANGKPVWP